MRTAVFDLDGTLADTSADLIAAANACFGAPLLDPEADRAVGYLGGRAMLRLGFSRRDTSTSTSPGPVDEAEVDRWYPRLLDHYAANLDTHTVLYPGVTDALDTLAANGWALAVCTNKPEALAEELLRRLKVRDRFAAMLGADTLPVRKPDPEHLFETIRRAGGQTDRAVLVGDTDTDRDTARNAGLPSVLVAFGPEGTGLSRLTPEAMLHHYDDLADLLHSLVP